MWYYLGRLDNVASGYIDRMSTMQWGMVVVVVVLIGIMCMQGYGSRNRL
jgi:hypothetical protein